jgi:3-carboxy-cis,cis-muconate cycloisomerase
MSRSSSPSDPDPFGFLVARGPVAAATTARAWVQAMLDAEAALAAAQADVGDIAGPAAAAIAEVCSADRFDLDELLAAAALGGNAVIALVPRLRELVGPDVAELVHRGATSQDIVDAATTTIVRRCADVVGDELLTASKAAAALGSGYGGVPVISRTLGQFAVPTTFATITARWTDGLAEASIAVSRTARLPVGLGGPSGDGTSFGLHGAEIAARFAHHLHTTPAPFGRHTQRNATAAVAGAWGLAAAAVAKVALDVVLLAGSDVGELAELADGAGGSSSMPHKHNPVAAISARAAAMQVPGLVSTLLHAAGSHELERAAGAWHAEWPAINQLLRATGSAVDWLQTSLERLVVDPERMAANLDRSAAGRVTPTAR